MAMPTPRAPKPWVPRTTSRHRPSAEPRRRGEGPALPVEEDGYPDMGPLGFDFESGFGLVNAERAVAPAGPPVCAGEIATITRSTAGEVIIGTAGRRHRRGAR